jgi:hypothetical protein
MTRPDAEPDSPPASDPAREALEELITAMDSSIDELRRARTRAEKLSRERESDRTWFDIVSNEEPPLVVESVSTVLSTLATAGHEWRREQAWALHEEHVSINRIAALYGVTRQRISALLREREGAEPEATSSV